MKWEQKVLRTGAIAIACAVFLRLAGGGVLSQAVELLTRQEVGALLLFLETGRVVTGPAVPDPTGSEPETTEPAVPTEPAQEENPLVFTSADAELLYIKNNTQYSVTAASLLEKKLTWNLKSEEPKVLILHTHTTESYENTEGYQQSSNYRTRDENYNMVSIGARLAQLLEAAGIGVIHAKTVHDYPSYNSSYENSRATVQQYLKEYPSIQFVLDIHRDAFTDSSGKYLGTTVTIGDQQVARLMMVMGSSGGGLTHPNWMENTALAAKLYARLETLAPGICRNLTVTNQRYNQDLSPGYLLLEVGAAGNTRQEALNAMPYLAQAITDLAYGTA